MAIIKLTKEQIKKLIDNNQITVYYADYWKYPQTGDDQKTCQMLDMMFQIERKSGYVIHIPNVKKGGV